MKFKLALAQADCVLRDVRTNLRKARSLIEEAVKERVELVVFPEMYLTGYPLGSETRKQAQSPDSPYFAEICALAKENGVALVMGYPELDIHSSKVYDSVFLVDRSGVFRGKQRKIHLYDEEKPYFEGGDHVETFETSLGRIGMMICYDVYFPEVARMLALRNADVILIPSADFAPFDRFVDKFIPSRAAENSVYVVYCNRVGIEKGHNFFGKSRVVDPRGDTLRQAAGREELLIAEIDSALAKQVREETGFLRNRRPLKEVED